MFMDSEYIANMAAEAADDKKAKNTILIDVQNVTTLTDWIVVTEGLSDVQVRAITNSIETKLKEVINRLPLRKEGFNEARWALLDYGEVIINVMQPDERNYYDLESFWNHGKSKIYIASEIRQTN